MLVFDYEEYPTVEDAIQRAKVIHLRLGDDQRIVEIAGEIPWPNKKGR